jgi:hypothetical protein
MKQKERIDIIRKTLEDASNEASTIQYDFGLHFENKKTWQQWYAERIDAALTAPQPEASDREIARNLVKEIVSIVKPMDITPLFSKDIDSACEHILKHDATIRADERRKAADRAKLLTYEMERCRGICINYKLEGGKADILLESVNRSLDRAIDLYRSAILGEGPTP